MGLHWSRAEIAAWVIAALGVAVMGILVWHGPFHNINKVAAKSAFKPLTVQIVTATGAKADQIGIYQPAKITAHVGQQINFVNNSNAAHTVTGENNVFDSGFLDKGGKSWPYTPSKTGTFHYSCQYHPLMKGTVVVVH